MTHHQEVGFLIALPISRDRNKCFMHVPDPDVELRVEKRSFRVHSNELCRFVVKETTR